MNKVALSLLVLAVFLSACSSTAEAQPEDLTGTWSTVEGAEPQMTAVIRSSKIEIDWTSEDMSALYWRGSFAEVGVDDVDIVSIGDTEAMDASILGSTEETKLFTFLDGQITFELGIMGVTQTIRLERVES